MIPTDGTAEPEMQSTLIAIFAALIMLTACGSSEGPDPDEPSVLDIVTDEGRVTLEVEIADDDDERARGLMERASLDQDAGMAFLWDEPVETSFWMKDTLIPLSIAFWDERGRILEILDMTPCRQDDCPRYGPGEPFVGALEVNLGFFEERGVEVGDRVTLDGVQ